jgi:glycosyltransferase involved in cell wall biosynthesis
MRVVYDYQAFNMQKCGGISRYIYEIATGLRDRAIASTILAPLHINEYLADDQQGLVLGCRRPDIPKTKRAIAYLNAGISQFALAQLAPNILHETYYSRINLAPPGCQTVLTVYDMIHEKFAASMRPREQQIAQIKRAAIQRADRIICISESTKRDLLERIDLDPSQVSVIHIAQALPKPLPDLLDNYPPFILFVGQRGGYKNFSNLVRAYSSNHFLHSNFNLLCFGSHPFTRIEKRLIRSLGLSEYQVIHISGHDRLLSSLYFHASAFVYPSLYEGFGIPLIEAMSLGCPVVCSNTSSFPEVAGEAAEFFDPHDTESMAVALENVLSSLSRINVLSTAGKKQAQKYSWQTCVNQTISVYESLLSA